MGVHRVVVLLVLFCLFSAYECFLDEDAHDDSDVQYSIETRIIVDKWAIQSWNSSINSILSDRDRTDQPRSIITDYLKSVFIGANAVFKDLETSGIRLDARIVSIEFIEDETIAEETVPGSGFVDVDSVLEQFHAWLAPKHYPRTDHTMLFTGLNMTNGTDGADPEKDPIGVAFIGRMCNPTKSLSAIQNIPNAKVSIVIAHELGHSLNASHDGDGNTCSNKSYNVMDAITENNNTKKWHFSTCSVAYFKDMLDALNNAPEHNCLTSTSAPEVDGTLLGKLFTPDQICRMSKGNHSRVCRRLYGYDTQPAYSSICAAMWCSASKFDSDCSSVFGADGFTCGNHKECSQGFCVPSTTAPAASDTCLLGDTPASKESPIFKNGPPTCSGLTPADDPHVCYSNRTRRACCASCEAALTGVPGCEFGDKAFWCSDLDYPYGCGLNAEVCCASCKPYYNASVIGCEYGDKDIACNNLTYPYACNHKDTAEGCCGSCAPYFKPANIGCEYGDKDPGCKNLTFPYTCNIGNNSKICCESCAPFYNASNTGCEFGDKDPGCSSQPYPYTCNRNAHLCCGSCAPFLNSSNAGCEFGDKNPDCSSLTYPFACSTGDNANICCGSCAPFYNAANKGCEYGDKAAFCSTLDLPYDCGLNADDCCSSCKPYYNASRVGCEYGDKTKDCETLTYPQACYSAQNANACCGTCAQYHDPTRVGCEYGDKSSGCSKTLAVPDSPFCQANNNICCLSCAADHPQAVPVG